jgi:hypothetical protein
MARNPRRKRPVNPVTGGPPVGTHPGRWDPIADPNTDGVFLAGQDRKHPDRTYGDLVAHLRQQVMAGEQTPAGITRAETSHRLAEEFGRAPYIHEVNAGLTKAGQPEQSEGWAERRAMFAADEGAQEQWRGKGSRQQAIQDAYDQSATDEEYQAFLARLNGPPAGNADD